eukprot:COSAG04_NODE_6711_length_1272_cov_1.241262_1_plen_94_part_10
MNGLRVSGFPTLTAHSSALGTTLDLGSFNGLYTHAAGDDTPDGFPVWRTGPEEHQRLLYIRTGEVDWIFNSELTPDSGTHWAHAQVRSLLRSRR